MKKIITALGLAGAFALAGLAVATTGAATPTTTLGVCNPGWYVNPDETDRKPTPTPAGMKFEGSQLIHHGATGSIEGLTAGTFAASPAPDQPSFFSVEVRNGDGTGYATLRWNTTTSKWNMVTGGTFYEHASAAELVKMPEPDRSSFLVSFGVGYTNSPPGTVATVVSSVSFKGVAYDLKCILPASSSSSSASATPSASSSSKPPSASASQSASQSPTAPPTSASASASARPPVVVGRPPSGGLALTGTPVAAVAGAGVALVLAGAALVAWLWRRNRVEFES